MFYAFYAFAIVILVLHFTGWLRRNNLEWLMLVLAVAVFPAVIFLKYALFSRRVAAAAAGGGFSLRTAHSPRTSLKFKKRIQLRAESGSLP